MENKELNLVKILKDCPKETKLYSPFYGEVRLAEVDEEGNLNIGVDVEIPRLGYRWFRCDGAAAFSDYDFSKECMLFPSKDNRDWSTFECQKPKVERFDPQTLQPFDKVIVRGNDKQIWHCTLFSDIDLDTSGVTYWCVGYRCYKQVIPYNDDTEHLLGTCDKAPEYYRYWAED